MLERWTTVLQKLGDLAGGAQALDLAILYHCDRGCSPLRDPVDVVPRWLSTGGYEPDDHRSSGASVNGRRCGRQSSRHRGLLRDLLERLPL